VRQNAKKRFANEKFALYPDQNALPRLRQIVAAADHYLPLRAPAYMTQLLLDHLKRAIAG
jgi:hypothetical protein